MQLRVWERQRWGMVTNRRTTRNTDGMATKNETIQVLLRSYIHIVEDEDEEDGGRKVRFSRTMLMSRT
jgi:hypothetical protein